MVKQEYQPNPEISAHKGLVTGKVALITGASRGIGRATAEALAFHGARAVIISSTENSEREANAALEVIRSYGAEGIWVGGQLEEKDTRQRIMKAVDTIGTLHVLVNNAGINKDNLFADTTMAEFESVMNINFKPAVLLAKASLAYLAGEGNRASIIFMSSVAVHGNPGQATYAASKGALEGIMRTIAVEWGESGLRANAVAPALVKTDMAARLDEGQRNALIQFCPYKRLLTTSEVADPVVFLASDMSRGINGQVINVDGGMFR